MTFFWAVTATIRSTGPMAMTRSTEKRVTIKLPKGSLRSTLLRLHRAYHETIPGIMARTPEHATFDELDPVAAH